MAMSEFGEHLRSWRQRRGLSQLQLSLIAGVSQRHISFLESGRAQPSRNMIVGLADALTVPLSERNALLQAAGFAALYRQSALDDQALAQVWAALNRMMEGHMPFPAVLIDRYWNLIDANAAAAVVFGLPNDGTVRNVLQLMAAMPAFQEKFENWPEVAHHFLSRLQAEYAASGEDPVLGDLLTSLHESPAFADADRIDSQLHPMSVARIRCNGVILDLFSTIAHFGTPTDITVSDLRIELFFPANAETEAWLEAHARVPSMESRAAH